MVWENSAIYFFELLMTMRAYSILLHSYFTFSLLTLFQATSFLFTIIIRKPNPMLAWNHDGLGLKLVEPKRIALSRTRHCLQSSSNHYTLARPQNLSFYLHQLYENWSLNQESNPKPIPYEGIALPIVLLRRGAANGAWTHNLFHTKELHYQLCYRSMKLVRVAGFAPAFDTL